MTIDPSPGQAAGTHPLRTYLVEDSSVIRDNLVGLLNDIVPVDVLGNAEDEAAAIDWLQNHGQECDLVILDIVLKAGSGLGVLAACHDRVGTAKWIVLSNHATPEMRQKCLEYGADAVFDKSNEIDSLLLYCKGLAGLDLIADARNSLASAC
jgi:DNA-binding NarL/FixJ family response regulator